MKLLYLRILLIIIIIVYNSLLLTSQSLVDSLYLKFVDAENDTCIVDLLNKMARELRVDNSEKAFNYVEDALKLANEINYTNGMARSYNLKGTINRYRGKYQEAMEYYRESIKLYEEEHNKEEVANTYNYIGQIYQALEMNDDALTYYTKALDVFKEINYERGIAFIINNLGLLYYELNNFDSSIYYFSEALEMSTILNDTQGMAHACDNLGNVYLKKYDIEKSEEYLRRALKLFNQIDLTRGKILVMINMGRMFNYLGDNDSSIIYLNTGLKLAEERNMMREMEAATEILAEVYMNIGELDKSIEYLLINKQFRDSLFHYKISNKIAETEIKYIYEQEKEKQDLKLLLQEKKNRIQRIIFFGSVLMLIMVLIFFYILFRHKVKHSTLAKEKLLLEKKGLKDELSFKNNELMNFALQIVQRNEFIEEVWGKLKNLRNKLLKDVNIKQLDEITLFINHSLNINKARKEFHMNIEVLNEAFFHKLKQKFTNLTPNEEKLALLLRLNYSSKKIAALLNLTVHAIEMSRYRLRKKLELDSKINLSEFFNSI